MIVYIVDDGLNIIYKGKIIKDNNAGIKKGYIINKEKFSNDFTQTIKKNKIRGKLFGDNIVVVKNSYFRVSDIKFIENIFLELGFIKVSFLDIKEIFPLKEALYVEFNKEYMVINLDEGIYLDLKYFKDVPKVLEILDEFIKGDIVFLGTNRCVNLVKVKNRRVYYFDNAASYVAESLLKVKKHGA